MTESWAGAARGVPSGEEINAVRQSAFAIRNMDELYSKVLTDIGDASIVMIGEATHGTKEFYHYRAEITKRLVQQKGFLSVAIEGDWPDAYRINRYAWGRDDIKSADDALSGFERFPTWMWRNDVMLDFVEWMQRYNSDLQDQKRVSLFGLDLYSLYTSMDEVIAYLKRTDPEAAKRAKANYACLEKHGRDTQMYGYASTFGVSKGCEDRVVSELVEIRKKALQYEAQDGRRALDEFFYTEQNARLVLNAERYYRNMFSSDEISWNLRDQHMADTVAAVKSYYDRLQLPFKIVIWAHNSHLGDARATDAKERGELNLGQLMREMYPRTTYTLGFSTFHGTVTAASAWDGLAEVKRVRPGMDGSWELLFHQAVAELHPTNFALFLRDHQSKAHQVLRKPKLQRAIGVIYAPKTERHSHYFYARPASQFDCLIHIDHTHALRPLEKEAEIHDAEVRETFPTGL